MGFTVEEHVGKARENEAFALTLDTKTPCAIEWGVTVRFYAALHYVQAYFAQQNITFTQHTNRATAIARDSRIQAAHGDYRSMQDYSESARYEVHGIMPGHIKFIQTCLDNIKTVIHDADPRVL